MLLDKTIIAIPLLELMQEEENNRATVIKKKGGTLPAFTIYDVVIDLHLGYRDETPSTETSMRKKASDRVRELIQQLVTANPDQKNVGVQKVKSDLSQQYVFAKLTGEMIRELLRLDKANDVPHQYPVTTRSIFRIWPDFKVKAFITKSISTVKVDAARQSFSALGDGIVWAVMIAFDYRGFGDSSGEATEAGLVKDAQFVYQWLETRTNARRRIYLWGHSLGSAVAVQVAAQLSAAQSKHLIRFSLRRVHSLVFRSNLGRLSAGSPLSRYSSSSVNSLVVSGN